MGITHVFTNLTEMYNNSNTTKIIINDLINEEDKAGNVIFDNILTIYESEILSTVPSCACPDRNGLYGRLNLGRVCEICGTEVKESYENIDSNMWLRALFVKDPPLKLFPTGEIPFITPGFWTVLTDLIHKVKGKDSNRPDLLRYFTDGSYKIPQKAVLSKQIINVRDRVVNECLGGKRCYITFINNIDKVFELLINHPYYTKVNNAKNKQQFSKAKQLELLYKIYKESVEKQDGAIFTSFIPIISKHVFVMEKTPKGKIVDLKCASSIEVVNTWFKLCKTMKENDIHGSPQVTPREIGKIMSKVIHTLSSTYTSYAREFLHHKNGIIRKHCYGARVPFTARGVIVSIRGKHDRKGIEVPWSIGLTIFYPHIMNKLKKRGYSMKEAVMLISSCYHKYDPVIDKIFKELIKEAPDNKIYAVIQRNPSLLRGSANLVYVSKFKTDPEDYTIGFSQLIVKAGNGDYDGDALNVLFLLDQKMVDLFKPFDPDLSNMDLDHPGSTTKHLTLLGPGNIIMLNFLKDRQPTGIDTLSDKLKVIGVKVDQEGNLI